MRSFSPKPLAARLFSVVSIAVITVTLLTGVFAQIADNKASAAPVDTVTLLTGNKNVMENCSADIVSLTDSPGQVEDANFLDSVTGYTIDNWRDFAKGVNLPSGLPWIGMFTQQNAAYVVGKFNSKIPVIKFKRPAGSTGSSNCASITMFPISDTEWRGKQMAVSLTVDFFRGPIYFTNPTTSGNTTVGSLKFYCKNDASKSCDPSKPVNSQAQKTVDFTITGTTGLGTTPGGGGTGGGGGTTGCNSIQSCEAAQKACTALGGVLDPATGVCNGAIGGGTSVTGHWLNVAQIKLDNGDIFQKFAWDKKPYYFLVSSGDATRSASFTWQNAKSKTSDPLSDNTASGLYCVPFIYLKTNSTIDFNNFNTSRLQTNLDAWGGVAAEYYNVQPSTGGAECLAVSAVTAAISITSSESPSGNAAKVWMYKSGDKLKTVFATGASNESPYLGEYTRDAKTGAYLGGSNKSCKATITPQGADTDAVFVGLWDFVNAECTGSRGTITVFVQNVSATTYEQVSTLAAAVTNKGTSIKLDCPWSLNPLTWIFCPLVKGAEKTVNTLDKWITSALTVKIDDYFGTNSTSNATYTAWNSIRAVALSILVIIALVMVISQAISFGPFDAYTVRKVLPRIVIAVIGISLSYQLSKILIGFSNDLGQGVGSLMYTPFKNLKPPTIGGGGSTEGILGLAIAGFAGVDIIFILSLALSAFAAVIVAFFVLTFRNIILIMLVILSPLAIVMWILPNTRKAWDIWEDNFTAVLLAFPIIVAFITSGRIFATIVSNSGNNGVSNGLFKDIIVFIAYFGPYFALPYAFKLAGGVVGNVAGMANDRSKGFFDSQRKARGERRTANFERNQQNRRFNEHKYDPKSIRGKVARRANTALSIGTSNPLDTARIYGKTAGGKAILNQIDNAKFQATDELSKNFQQIGISNDKALKVLAGRDERVRQVRNAADLERAIAVLSQGNDQERIGASQLQSASNIIQNAFKDPKTGRGVVEAAALYNWSSQGFADANDITAVSNSVGGALGARIANQATYLGYSSGKRLDLKPTYGVQYDPSGKTFYDGISLQKEEVDATGKRVLVDKVGAERDAAIQTQEKLVKGLKTFELIGAKSGTIKNVREGVVSIVTKGKAIREQRETLIANLNQQLEAGAIDTARRDAELSQFDSSTADDVGLARSIEQVVGQNASKFSQSDADSKRQWQEIAASLGIDPSRFDRGGPDTDGPSGPGTRMGE